MKNRAALFDLDGVIIDTEPAYSAFWAHVGNIYFPNEKHFAENIKGHSLTDIFASYFSENAEVQENITLMLKEQEGNMSYPLIDGGLEIVRHLRDTGWKTAIVTSSNKAKMAHLYCEHPEFCKLFDAIFTAEDALRSKPAPDCYIHAAEVLGCKAKDCVIFEDSISGLQAARSSGAYVVGLTTSHGREIIAPLADVVIDTWADYEKTLVSKMKI